MEGQRNLLIYGSTGYTGRLVVDEAIRRGLRPLLAGRDIDKVGRQAAKAGLEWRAFRLSDTRALERALADTGLVLLLAGPYKYTCARVVEACLRTGAHYLDINGELDIYEWLAGCDREARLREVMLVTGLGFDVAPSDCLAVYLKRRLPTADELRLAFAWKGKMNMSHGTLKSGLVELSHGIRVRHKGRLVPSSMNAKSLVIDFGWGPVSCDLISWGDLVTAYYSTGIPDIETYTPIRFSQQRQMAMLTWVQRALSWSAVRSLAGAMINLFSNGLTAAERAQVSAVIWGQVRDPSGWRAAAQLYTPESYTLTSMSAVLAVQMVLRGEVKHGFQTPAMAFGEDFIFEVEGVKREDLEV